MDGWMDGWMDLCIYTSVCLCTYAHLYAHVLEMLLEFPLASCPGCAVLDLGAGSGLLAILAARAGS